MHEPVDDDTEPDTVGRDGRTLPPIEGEYRRIGPFHILSALGSGGMGAVYLAEQREPLRRQVAIKLIRGGLYDRRLLKRFQAEAQAMALLTHANVARVYDAGSTEDGRPYIAMEYVPGQSITRWCDARNLPLRRRLELMIDVCEGVRHAHQKAIIHRDLKPSNVLVAEVEGRAVAKIIDFGLAKGLDQPLTGDTQGTIDWGIVGTLQYLSPEAIDGGARGIDVDTRTDVYALGVILFELLVGRLPFTGEDTAQLIGRVLTGEPPRPSVALAAMDDGERAAAARLRGTDPATHRRMLRRDLDWIVLKAVARDRTSRYGSAAELSADLQRLLDDQPVTASPPSTLYRASKFVRRHKAAVAAAALAVLALAGGLVLRSREAARANREAARASQEAAAARQVADFMASLFRVSQAGSRKPSDVSARELLDRGAERIREELKDQPLVRARLLDTIGDVYRSMGLYEPGRPLLVEALETRRRLLGPDDPAVAETLQHLATLDRLAGRSADAEAPLREAVRILERSGQTLERARALMALANVESDRSRFPEAERLLLEAVAIREQAVPDSSDLAATLNNLGNLYHEMGRLEDAARVHERSLAIKEKVDGPDHYFLSQSLSNLANVYTKQKRFDLAESMHRRALAIKRNALEANHPEIGVSEHNLGDLAFQRGDLKGAEAQYAKARDIWAKTFPPGHPYLAFSDQGLANVYRELGRTPEARELYEHALATFRNHYGPDHPYVTETRAEYDKLKARAPAD
jgi:non-specific serine/threonine protein kinase/serine/threonine-protein kinase